MNTPQNRPTITGPKIPWARSFAFVAFFLGTLLLIGCEPKPQPGQDLNHPLPCTDLTGVPMGTVIMVEGEVTHIILPRGAQHRMAIGPSGLRLRVTNGANIKWDMTAVYRAVGYLHTEESEYVMDSGPILDVTKIECLGAKEDSRTSR
ncbi:MAG: hypothetical protein V2B20_10500 [Pseudomonadota bacterium]